MEEGNILLKLRGFSHMPIVRAPALFGALLVGLLALQVPAHAQAETPDLTAFFTRVQSALAADSPAAYLALVAPTEGGDFALSMVDEIRVPGTTNVTLRERDRSQLAGALPGEGFRVIVEILTERGQQARLATWRVDVKLARGDAPAWRIVDQERLSSVDGLFRLALDTATQYDVSDLTVQATDFRLEMSSGQAFVARTPQGVTALVLRGRGLMRFTPPPPSERTQLRIFAGSEELVTEFDTAFVRMNPATFDERVTRGALHPREVNDRDLRRAQSVFDEMVRKTYTLNLTDMGFDSWSLLPSGRDMVAEVHTKRFDTLTYVLAAHEAEDVSLFDRKKRYNISSYASPEKLGARGRFYNEDDLVDYDVLDYMVNATFDPRREWIDGQTTVTLRVTAPAVSTITLLLEEDLVVRAVSSSEFGRLMFLRIVGQDNLIVNLPTFVMRDSEIDLTVSYGGRLPAQQLEREAIVVEQDPQNVTLLDTAIPAEPHYVYSNRVHWYPRSQVHDYALATLRITLPEDYACVATGVQAVGSPIRLPETAERPASTTFVFIVGEPARYLSVVISKFVLIEPLKDTTGAPLSAGGRTATLAVETNPRQQSRGRSLQPTARAILDFYTGIMGDAPYPQFTLAVTESRLPGGHSPAYFAVLNQPLPSTPFRWRNDPVSFDNFPSFFLAHEIAHQWWGQAIGWTNYHEQWLSEGTAQYFAALWEAHDRGADAFGSLMRQMRDWSLRYSDQGPIYLGYRLGHVKGESQIFRALVYNKAAVVLHMLRRLLGDEAFFAGLRSFYQEFKYRKASSDDLRRSMEAASGVPLESFFEQWIYGSAIPRLRVSSRIQQEDGRRAGTVTVRFEQAGRPFDVPVTVTLLFESGDRQDVVVKVAGRVTEATITFDKPLHRVLFNDDNAALAEIDD